MQSTMAEQEGMKAPQPLGTVLPRITIQFCTQCKWMLRAAYVKPPPPPPVCSQLQLTHMKTKRYSTPKNSCQPSPSPSVK